MFHTNLTYSFVVLILILRCASSASATNFKPRRKSNLPTVLSDCKYQLTLTQDGPVTLDIPITFHANLSCASGSEEHIFHFEDNADPPQTRDVVSNSSVSETFVYPEDIYKPGEYVMSVSAYVMMIEHAFNMKIAKKNVSFIITEYILGQFEFVGTTTRDNDEDLYAPTGKDINMTIDMNYNAYKNSEMSFSWNIDKDQFITTTPDNSYKFSRPGSYLVHASVVARIPVQDKRNIRKQEIKYKWGSFHQKLIVKDPFYAVNLTGNTYLQHGQLFNLDVSCNGSGPFEYCWKVMLKSDNMTNLTCSSPVVTTQCSFPIIYYFHQSGDYGVVIYVDNFVSAMQRNVEVHIYDVSSKPQLSTVIIPLFCSVLVVFIIASGIVLHLQRKKQLNIETADFDFMHSDPCDVETFWERLYNSILRTLGIVCQIPRQVLCISNGVSEDMNRVYSREIDNYSSTDS